MPVVGALLVADETGHEALFHHVHHPQGLLLWHINHTTLLYIRARHPAAIGVVASAGPFQFALSWLRGLNAMLPYVEPMPRAPWSSESHQLGLSESSGDYNLRLVGAWREHYNLFPCRFCPDIVGNVSRGEVVSIVIRPG